MNTCIHRPIFVEVVKPVIGLHTWLLTLDGELLAVHHCDLLPSPRSIVTHPTVEMLVSADILNTLFTFDPTGTWALSHLWIVWGYVEKHNQFDWQECSMWRWREVRAHFRTKLRRGDPLVTQINTLYQARVTNRQEAKCAI